MARRPNAPAASQAPARLEIPREEAKANLLTRVALGEELSQRSVNSTAMLDELRAEYRRWTEYNAEMLRRIFSSTEYQLEYDRAGFIGAMVIGYGQPFSEKVSDFREGVVLKINKLRSLAERLDLIDVSPTAVEARAVPSLGFTTSRAISDRVFLVHGRDDEAKAVVARFLEHCGLSPIILHEQVDQGRTIIEKFEQEANVGFAVVLLTPDDVGGLAAPAGALAGALTPRARQNVVLELGYFLGRLGRSRVCALRRGELELPSDISGVVYTPYGADDGWKLKLARELKAAGYDVDLNDALA